MSLRLSRRSLPAARLGGSRSVIRLTPNVVSCSTPISCRRTRVADQRLRASRRTCSFTPNSGSDRDTHEIIPWESNHDRTSPQPDRRIPGLIVAASACGGGGTRTVSLTGAGATFPYRCTPRGSVSFTQPPVRNQLPSVAPAPASSNSLKHSGIRRHRWTDVGQ